MRGGGRGSAILPILGMGVGTCPLCSPGSYAYENYERTLLFYLVPVLEEQVQSLL